MSRCVAATNAPEGYREHARLKRGQERLTTEAYSPKEVSMADSGSQPNVANGPVDFPAHSIRESPGQRDGVRYKRADGPFVGPLKNSPNNISNLTRARGSPLSPLSGLDVVGPRSVCKLMKTKKYSFMLSIRFCDVYFLSAHFGNV